MDIFHHAKSKTTEELLQKENWKEILYSILPESANPLFVFPKEMIPGASIWSYLKLWKEFYRELNLSSGEVLGIHLPTDSSFLGSFLAGLWEDLSVACIPFGKGSLDSSIDSLRPKWIVTLDEDSNESMKRIGYERVLNSSLPDSRAHLFRRIESSRDISDNVRLFLKSSGTSGAQKWVGLSDSTIFHNLRTHNVAFPKEGSTVGSVLPWTHSFGLILDFFPSLLRSSTVIKYASSSFDLEDCFEFLNSFPIRHLSGVPSFFSRILNLPGGCEFLESLESGIVGGAPISSLLAKHLRNTKLRVGYGQTEAGPGITLGEPGDFDFGYLGKPVGCEVKIDSESGSLLFRGKNASSLEIDSSGCVNYFFPEEWRDTRDIVRKESDRYYFIGRSTDHFKLQNGKFLYPFPIESSITELLDLPWAFVFQSQDLNTICILPDDSSPERKDKIRSELRERYPWIEELFFATKDIVSFSAKGEILRSISKSNVERWLHS
ncbi:AMP-binding protein [Leptospira stimsonii]|uniref:Long-chain fatty acid--CoA ligase n=1 Tax=Leptospira stimsonii TaxID=2202203 RepID=A0ABY2MY33_9LEPT|nr:AMP-binding protein [Leptospira stimsonii]TGK14359.1 long-chain fatty acid--CoA ligase [Leptospira stimsonii]TGM11722.1 long-chain fatty acid--CoA ligase [Leptospira stimsonii]